MALICCLDGIFAVENPATSLVLLHPRLLELFKNLRLAGIKVAWLMLREDTLSLTWLFENLWISMWWWNFYINIPTRSSPLQGIQEHLPHEGLWFEDWETHYAALKRSCFVSFPWSAFETGQTFQTFMPQVSGCYGTASFHWHQMVEEITATSLSMFCFWEWWGRYPGIKACHTNSFLKKRLSSS